jgi:hypothetical protein
MLRKHDQVLDIDDAISEGCRADVTQGVVFAPVVNHYAHIRRVNNSIAIEVNDRKDWGLPYVLATDSAGSGGFIVAKIKQQAIR